MTYSRGAPNPEILGPSKSTHPSQTRGGGRSGGQGIRDALGCARGVWEVEEKESPNPHPQPRDNPKCPPTLPHCGGPGEDCGNPPRTLSRGSSRVLPQHPYGCTSPACPGPEGRRVCERVGRQVGIPPPQGADRRRGDPRGVQTGCWGRVGE